MKKFLHIFLLCSILIIPSQQLLAQPNQELHVNADINFDKELSSLMNELDLSNDQKIIIGMLILKYSLDFNYDEFDKASNTKKYSIAKSKMKEIDKELKTVLDKNQYKIYKKRKKAIKKKLMKSV